ncbi:hypothetical protein HHI36_017516 [Cryptolaemus montrouzieri]|uniref:Uncharacterized protein n=1 Tax=Cryptolaemus montrouzieri TaxID=559131 RepID=A0ABD2NMR6_9CUCU
MKFFLQGTTEVRAELERLQNTIANLQKSNLFFEAKNIELKMDLERSQKDFPRFREQIQHLENYIEVLKNERNDQIPSSSDGVHPSQTKPESRKVSELERTVLILKRVVEKLQTENKRLLSGKRPLMDRTGSADKLRREFNRLKEQYGESVRKVSDLEATLNATTHKLRTYEERCANSDLISLSGELKRIKAQLDQKSQLLDKVKVLLHRAATKEKALLQEIADLKMQLGTGNHYHRIQASTSQI